MRIDLSNPLVIGGLVFITLVIIYLLIKFVRYLINNDEVVVSDGSSVSIEEVTEAIPELAPLEEVVPPPPNPKQIKPFKKKSALKLTTEK